MKAIHVIISLITLPVLLLIVNSWLLYSKHALPLIVYRGVLNNNGKQILPLVGCDRHEQISKPHHLLLVAVLSSHHNWKKRDVIRQTWRNSYVDKQTHFSVYFVMGTLFLNISETEKLVAENDLHKDLVFLHEHLDSYTNLTRKVLQTFIWMDHHMNYSYLMKADDDTFARLDAIESELKERTSKALYWGFMAKNSKPELVGPWAEHNWFLSPKYLPFALGGGYILSSDLIHRIVVNADGLSLYNNEDVSVGVWTSQFNIERKHDSRFQVDMRRDNICDGKSLVLHHVTKKMMWVKSNVLNSTGNLCGIARPVKIS